MAHFAKLNQNNEVIFITVGRDEDNGLESELTERTGDIYKQTSYNTRGGVHYTNNIPSDDQSKAYRKNFAGIGFTYDSERDAFIPPKPYSSWVLNEQSCQWEAPVPRPTEGLYKWNEESVQWVEVSYE
jgi:hypothetical protein